MRSDGSDARRLTSLAGAEYMPSWSPDGKHMVYVKDPDGWTDVAAVVLLPTGRTQDIYSSGPEPSSIWQVDLATSGGRYRITHTQQRTKGGSDLFPRFAPDWLR
jgi:Tol biopolymer transport system component